VSKYLDLARGVSDGDRSPQPPVSGPEDTLCGISGLSGLSPSMDSWGIRLAACDLGIKVSVTKDDVLTAEPASLLTPALRGAIHVHKADLLYDVLLAEALRYVAVERHVEGADLGAVLDAHQDEIDAAYLARDWPAYRAAIRAFASAGRREAERARDLYLSSDSLGSPRTMTVGAKAARRGFAR
jgi:hypothetical protein